VLLTGVTGFIGMELLVRYLECTNRRVYAFVRGKDDREATARVERTLLSLFGADHPHGELLGSADLTGGKLFHVLSGHLSHQIEHHLFPDLPANRYSEIAVEVREICRRYELPYNTGPLTRQFGSVVRKIARFALPSRASTA
jgi:hypothetical protein